MTTEGHGHGHFRKPYKVWTADRTVRKGLTATTLDDLIRLAKQKLEVDEEVTVVLEDDGTEIDSELYFQTLQTNTVFLVLRKNERWHPAGVDAIRAAGRDETDQKGEPAGMTPELVQKALHDNNSLLFMSLQELECLSKLDPGLYQQYPPELLRQVVSRATVIYEERKVAKDQLDLLKVIDKAMGPKHSQEIESVVSPDEPDRCTTNQPPEIGLLNQVLRDSNSLLFMSIDQLQSLSDLDPAACPGVNAQLLEDVLEQAGKLYIQRMDALANLNLARVVTRVADQSTSSAAGDKI